MLFEAFLAKTGTVLMEMKVAAAASSKIAFFIIKSRSKCANDHRRALEATVRRAH